jgi:serine/threonine protein phosphatase PrpC
MNGNQVATFQDNASHGEDAFVVRDLGGSRALDSVLDGVTHCEGGYASSFTAQLLETGVIEGLADLIALLEQANQILFQSGRGRNPLTTVSAVLYEASEAHILSLGDSPVYLVRDGAIRLLTPQLEISPLPGLEGGAVGLKQELAYSLNSTTLRSGDVLLLTTDGLVHNLTADEIGAILDEESTPSAALSRIETLIGQKRWLNLGREDSYGTFKEDDQTAIVRFIS